ncbi:hypothetical protein [Streptosporangium sp. NPDC000396]|uniref:hypothetical protein n=1 Tax=Streptosporangium sp. NPDC000396 TaxID=3366185 RepID=UPI0036AA8C6B
MSDPLRVASREDHAGGRHIDEVMAMNGSWADELGIDSASWLKADVAAAHVVGASLIFNPYVVDAG